MTEKKAPRLRTVNKSLPPYELNRFPNDFAYKLGRELVYLLATKGTPTLEGSEWEEIFANCIGAKWKPSNVGLDDVVLASCAWGAKTLKAKKPSIQKTIRLISGRNSPVYSFGEKQISEVNPDHLGSQVLEIWNERVSAIRKLYKFVRTVVLLKSDNLAEVAVFEYETIRYDQELYAWKWNDRGNLEGFLQRTNEHCFTWQPHGSQFTIIEKVPDNCLVINIRLPEQIDKDELLQTIGFDNSWVRIVKK